MSTTPSSWPIWSSAPYNSINKEAVRETGRLFGSQPYTPPLRITKEGAAPLLYFSAKLAVLSASLAAGIAGGLFTLSFAPHRML